MRVLKDEKIDQLEQALVNHEKEIRRRDIVVANLARELNNSNKIRSQVRKLLRMINNRITTYFYTMKTPKVIDNSTKVKAHEDRLTGIVSTNKLLKNIQDHDKTAYTEIYEDMSAVNYLGEVLSSIYSLFLNIGKFIIFNLLKVFSKKGV